MNFYTAVSKDFYGARRTEFADETGHGRRRPKPKTEFRTSVASVRSIGRSKIESTANALRKGLMKAIEGFLVKG